MKVTVTVRKYFILDAAILHYSLFDRIVISLPLVALQHMKTQYTTSSTLNEIRK